MVNVDVSQLGRYLTPSKEKMKAKGVKSVQSRVCNLKDLNPEITTDALRAALKESFVEAYGDFVELDPAIFENGEVQETYNLYSSWDWKFGKSPECETSYSKRFDWGELEVWLRLKICISRRSKSIRICWTWNSRQSWKSCFWAAVTTWRIWMWSGMLRILLRSRGKK
ncbi:MAG: hypothetical protein V8Q27_02340 [Eubacteriales bacterium]